MGIAAGSAHDRVSLDAFLAETRALAAARKAGSADFEEAPRWFHDYQLQAWESTARIIAICAGWQSGKTVLLSPWLCREIKRRGPGDYGAFSATYKLLSRKFLPELKKTFRPYTDWRASDQQFILTPHGERAMWGYEPVAVEPTVIQLGHAENPDSLESATLKAVVWDECGQRLVPEQSYHTVESRLMVNRGRMLLASRPYEFGWFQRLVHAVQGPREAGLDIISFPSWANPENPPELDDYYQEKIRTWPAWRFDMMYRGIFTRPAGLIYSTFNYNLDSCDDFTVPPHWKRYPCMDFGPVNTAGLVIAEDPHSHELFVTLEYLSPGKREMRDHAAELKRGGPLTVGAGGSKQEVGWRDSAKAQGIWLDELPVSDVEVQIQCVYEQIAGHNLKFFRKAAALTISDIESFSREIDPDTGDALLKIAGHEPHRLAALRYGITKLRPPKALLKIQPHVVRDAPHVAVHGSNQPQTPAWDLTGRFG